MSDHRARQIQREALATGDAQAEARVLRERLRAGTLLRLPGCLDCDGQGFLPSDNARASWRARRINRVPRLHDGPRRDVRCPACNGANLRPAQDTVELLAYLGHPGARVLVGHCQEFACARGGGDPAHAHSPISVAPFADWLRGLERWGLGAVVRAAIAAAGVVWDQQHEASKCPERCGAIEAALHAACDWADDPSDARNEGWREAADEAIGPGGRLWVPHPDIAPQQTLRHITSRLTDEGAARDAVVEALTAWALA